MVQINSKTLEKQLKGRDIVLFVLSNADYSEKVTELARIVSERNQRVCYVSANKPAKALIKLFGGKRINAKKFWFIDCISRSSFGEGNANKGQNESVILYTSSPGNLTELSINITGALTNGATGVFVDALSTFLIYEEGTVVIRFAHNVISRLREYECKGYFVVLKNDISSSLLDDLSMFVDGVVEV